MNSSGVEVELEGEEDSVHSEGHDSGGPYEEGGMEGEAPPRWMRWWAEEQRRMVGTLVKKLVKSPKPGAEAHHLEMTKMTEGDNTEAFINSFKRMAVAAGWPRAQWAAILTPYLMGEAQRKAGEERKGAHQEGGAGDFAPSQQSERGNQAGDRNRTSGRETSYSEMQREQRQRDRNEEGHWGVGLPDAQSRGSGIVCFRSGERGHVRQDCERRPAARESALTRSQEGLGASDMDQAAAPILPGEVCDRELEETVACVAGAVRLVPCEREIKPEAMPWANVDTKRL